MRYILVSGSTPFRRSTCAACGEAISNSYLREMSTHLYYCDPACYSNHCYNAVMALAARARAMVGLESAVEKRSATAELTISK